MGTKTMRARILGAFVALSLIAAGCSSGSASDDDSQAAASSGPADVPASLEFLGDLAKPRSERFTSTLDAAAGSVILEAGASVAVAAGAFTSATELTTQVLDFDLTDTLGDDAPWGRAYVVSTVEDVSLGAPVTIEIERPASELRAMQFIDGVWSEADVLGGSDSARIEIPHFSEVVTLVLQTWGEEAAALARAELAALSPNSDDTPANFLRTCLVVVLGTFGGFTSDGVDELYSQLAFSICTNALIARSAPDGKYVSTACVGDTISGGLDFQEAVDKCAAENDEELEDDADAPEQSEESGRDGNASTDSSVGVDAVYTGQASAEALGDDDGSYRLRSASFEARVEADTVDMTVSTSLFIWWRGGDDGGPSGDQNCGGTINETISGTGPAGSPTRIDFTIVSSELVSTTGALCQGDEPDRDLSQVGDRAGSFQGQLNGLGMDGDLVFNPSGFVQTLVPLQAS